MTSSLDALDALDAGDVTKLGVGLIIAIVVIGIVLALVISAIIGRIVIAVIVIALGAFIWQQRSSVENKIDSYKHDACSFNASFFGVNLSAPDQIKQLCQQQRHHGHGRRA